MRASIQFVLLVIGLVIVAALSLSPRRDEQVAMLVDEGRYEEAIIALKRRIASSSKNPELFAALGRAYSAIGEHRGAAQALQSYVALRPNDIAAHEKLAELQLQNGSIDAALQSLARTVKASPTPERVTRLIELYRLFGRFDEELATLRDNGNMLTLPHLERLAFILADRGELPEALRWLRIADERASVEASTVRILLLDVLVESRRIDEAYQRARNWIRNWRSPYLAGKLLIKAARSGFGQHAVALAQIAAESMPAATFDMASVLTEQGHGDLAEAMLRRWTEVTAKPTRGQLRNFVFASIKAGDMRSPFLMLLKLAREHSDGPMIGTMAQELVSSFGPAAIAPLRPILSHDVLLTVPLFAAELALAEGNPYLARWHLMRIEPADLEPEQRLAWLALLRQVDTPSGVFDRLVRLWNEGRMPPELIRPLADEALQVGQTRLHDLVLASLIR